MNQSLINELRAHSIKIHTEMVRIEKYREENEEAGFHAEYNQLLLAKSNCLNGIAVLVAANKR